MKIKWLVIAVLIPALCCSQSKTKSSLHTIVSAGAAAGEGTAKPLAQVAAGLHYDRYFTGIGVGLDNYRFRSIPLFADWRMNFGNKQSIFVFANGGYNFSVGNQDEGTHSFETSNRFYGGFYFDTGLGYRFRLSSSHRLLLSAGYSQKNIRQEIGYTYPCFNPPCNEDFYNYHYNLGRITAKIAWEFGSW